jgi:D-alanyl-D-alanine carboxypeptidase (penicillin-binding protein 5/6)
MIDHLFTYLKNKSLTVGWGALLLALTVSFLPVPHLQPQVAVDGTTTPLTPNNEAFSKITLTAQSAIVYDLNNNRVIFEKNARSVKPLASITKLMTALTASDYLNDNDIIKITANDLANGSNAGLEQNRNWRFIDLRDYMLTTSSNGAAEAIARATRQKATTTFEALMNSKARELKLADMTFGNPTGLSTAHMPQGTAYGVALLLKDIREQKPEILNSTRWYFINKTTADNHRYLAKNTNQTVNTIFGLLGSKTGFTNEAGGNLAIVFDAGVNLPVAVVVLDSTYDGRFTDVNRLVKATLSYYAN